MTTPTDIQLPTGLPVLPGWALAGRYLMTGAPPTSRGDTLDAFPLHGERCGLVVGDVVGHGFPAAIAATQLRTIARERLVAGEDPAGVVRGLHRFADQVADLQGATLAVVVLGPAGEVDFALAGHPPPLAWDDLHAPLALPGPRGRPLGAGGVVRAGRAVLDASGALLLHTDGLASARRRPSALVYDARLGLRRDDGPGGVHERADRLADRLLGTGAGRLDDAAVLVAARTPTPAPVARDLPALPGSVRRAEEEVGPWLLSVGAGLADQLALHHVVEELVRNVVEHAYVGPGTQARPRGLHLALCHDDDGRVRLSVADRGRWREPRADLGGRGIVLASGLVDDLRLRRTDTGTEVEVRHELRRPVLVYTAENAGVAPDSLRLDPARELHLGVVPGRLVAAGAVDDAGSDALAAALVEATLAGSSSAVVDLSGVSVLASAGLRCLVAAGRRCRRSGSRLQLVAAPGTPADRVLQALEIPHLRAETDP